ncbi:pyridoxamine 5'-phosphate oxidase family protein [Methylobrevis albus]|uniref:Pyridoxamine 5'-phosphate oxidase family protein n=1 Tax=Methylobrevis albus TaxID=2793297 RepID=A0A931I404_9HYPH|nr:pyridoxamine 5'-phosphate oxidase family protein [Methylobrevis albus]MBH0239029.1 pyridoxamine 5'-phosphate oxidase family protein [Methylobrevis albus]
MAREEQTSKTPEELVDRAWELAKDIKIAMFNTWNGKVLHSRPMDASVERDNGAVYFLTDVDSYKVDELAEHPQATLAFANASSYKFVTMTGRAAVSNDRAKIKEIFTPDTKAWWDSEDDPRIRLITFTPDDAEIWDSPGVIVSSVKMLAAAVTGAKPKFGDHAKVAI